WTHLRHAAIVLATTPRRTSLPSPGRPISISGIRLQIAAMGCDLWISHNYRRNKGNRQEYNMTATAIASRSDMHQHRRVPVGVEEYRAFRRDGFLVVRQLVSPEQIDELRRHTEDLMAGRLPEQKARMGERDLSRDTGTTSQGLEAPPEHLSPEEKAQYFLRIHMLHRRLELHERYMLNPGVLDVLEVLIGPDVLA